MWRAVASALARSREGAERNGVTLERERLVSGSDEFPAPARISEMKLEFPAVAVV
jgi:hypothetical protein